MADQAQSSGLLSSLKTYVSREIESFVLNATGKPAPVASSSRLDQPKRTHNQSQKKTHHKAPKLELKTRPRHIQLRTDAATMPGSLYPRSQSILPDTPARHIPREPTPTLSDGQFSDSDVFPTYTRKSQKALGKQRAREDSPADFMRGKPGSLADELARADTSVEIRSNVRGMELELQEAREQYAQNEGQRSVSRIQEHSAAPERQLSVLREASFEPQALPHPDDVRDEGRVEDEASRKDKERIRALEREIDRLKEELSKRPSARSHSGAPQAPTALASLFKPGASTGDLGAVFASARASLRHAPTPVEAPINGLYAGARTRRTGQPTVNVSGEKMAEFLREVTTVRLRRVGSIGGNSSQNFDRSFDMGSQSLDDAQIGDKRKRANGEDFQGVLHAAVKRRASDAATKERTNSFATASSGRSYFNYADTRYPRESAEVPPPSSIASSSQSRSGPLVSNTSTDLTTPSLCSDNEEDQDVQAPSSPLSSPLVHEQHDDQLADVHLDEEEERQPAAKKYPNSPHINRFPGAFGNRVPSSPMPEPSPTRARPPARALRSGIPIRAMAALPPPPNAASSDEDPLSLTFAPKPTPSPRPTTTTRIPVPNGLGRAQRVPVQPGDSSVSFVAKRVRKPPVDPRPARAASRHEYELETGDTTHAAWHYDQSLYQPDRYPQEEAEEVEDGEEVDLESGVFLGVGTRSKNQGFLAHGGAGGEPVFMGVGYVDGVESA